MCVRDGVCHIHLCLIPFYTHTHHPTHTTWSYTIFHTHLFIHDLSYTTWSHTIFQTHLCHTPSFTHNFCHTPSFTHIFVTHHLTQHLSHTSLSHTIFHHFTKHLCQAAGYRNKNKNPTQRFGGINIHREKYWK